MNIVRNRWIPVSERLPEERDSIFAKLKGTDKWKNYMFEKTSTKVIVTICINDGSHIVTTAHTIDGRWKTDIFINGGEVIAWMPLPEPWKGERMGQEKSTVMMGETERIKVSSLDIIVTMIDQVPYYEIKYKEIGESHYNIGYSSYELSNVLAWKDNCFELCDYKTNADSIRGMTDEELDTFLCNLASSDGGCDSCPASGFCYKGHSGYSSWLSMEA